MHVENDELTAKELSRVGNVKIRTAQYWLAGRFSPSRLVRERLKALGLKIVIVPRGGAKAKRRRRKVRR